MVTNTALTGPRERESSISHLCCKWWSVKSKTTLDKSVDILQSKLLDVGVAAIFAFVGSYCSCVAMSWFDACVNVIVIVVASSHVICM